MAASASGSRCSTARNACRTTSMLLLTSPPSSLSPTGMRGDSRALDGDQEREPSLVDPLACPSRPVGPHVTNASVELVVVDEWVPIGHISTQVSFHLLWFESLGVDDILGVDVAEAAARDAFGQFTDRRHTFALGLRDGREETVRNPSPCRLGNHGADEEAAARPEGTADLDQHLLAVSDLVQDQRGDRAVKRSRRKRKARAVAAYQWCRYTATFASSVVEQLEGPIAPHQVRTGGLPDGSGQTTGGAAEVQDIIVAVDVTQPGDDRCPEREVLGGIALGFELSRAIPIADGAGVVRVRDRHPASVCSVSSGRPRTWCPLR